MRLVSLAFACLVLAAPVAAAAQGEAMREWRMAPEYDVLLTSFEIQPRLIRLKAGEPVRLRFVNNSEQVHRFNADDFFRNSDLKPSDRRVVHRGSLTVPPLSDTTVSLVPKAGHYAVTGDNLFRRVLGMSARIVVE